MMERTVLFYDFHRQYRMPRSQNVLRLGQNRSLGPTGPNWTAIGVNWLAGFDFEIKVIARIPDHV
jgi:enamine deaminase RidA (YjgF/YER057c/UK114 family)